MKSIMVLLVLSGIIGHFPALAEVHVMYSVPSACKDRADQLSELVKTYQSSAYNNKSEATEKTYQKIEQFLFQDNAKNDCTQALLNQYIALCFGLYDSDRVTVHTAHSGWGGSVRSSNIFGVRLVLEHLLENNIFVYLTDEMRVALGEAWQEKIPNSSEYTSLGAYDCATSKIYIDPHLRPFDLLTTIYHEVDHLLRDKMQAEIPAKLLKPGSTKANPQVDWELFNLAEEAEAISTSTAPFLSALSQARPVGWTNSVFTRMAPVYRIRQDFTMFSKDGLISQFRHHHEDQSESVNSALLFGWGQSGIALSPLDQNLRNQFFGVISKTYFPMKQESFLENSSEDLASYFDFDSSTINALSWEQGAWENSFKMFQATQDLESWLKSGEPSNTCKLYLKSLQRDEVHGYLGTQFMAQDQTKSVIRPCINLHREL